MSKANPTTPLVISLAMVIAGVLIAAVSGSGLSGGSVLGGLVAGLGLIPSCYAAWAGIQQETQKSLGMAILMVLVSLATGGLLLVLALFDKIF
jgi:hypothetical protein